MGSDLVLLCLDNKLWVLNTLLELRQLLLYHPEKLVDLFIFAAPSQELGY
jgi:hypothetical protein